MRNKGFVIQKKTQFIERQYILDDPLHLNVLVPIVALDWILPDAGLSVILLYNVQWYDGKNKEH